MRRFVKQAVAPLARAMTANCARVLVYHRFGTDGAEWKLDVRDLEEQLLYLRRNRYRVISLRDLVSRLRDGRRPEPRTVVLTVDDAYTDFADLAYPLFCKYEVPVTLFVVSEFASGNIWLWWDAIRCALTYARSGHYRVMGPKGAIAVTLSDGHSRYEVWDELAEVGLQLSLADQDQFIKDVQGDFSVSLPSSPPKAFAAMDWDALQSLDPEIVEIGAHSRTHPVLARCDSARLVDEVVGSKKTIEQRLGREVSGFCYPNGQRADVDERCVAAVRDAGYDYAVMACGTMVCENANLFALNRMPASDVQSVFVTDMSGVSHIRQRIGDWIKRTEP